VKWKYVFWGVGGTMALFLTWRFLRPFQIYTVSAAFEKPIKITTVPPPSKGLSARECGVCHKTIYDEWNTTMHRQAWTEPYFQADFKHDGSPQNCRNCHTPLENQQEYLVLGFRDAEKWDPILQTNKNFDPSLQVEGVTCAACHVRDGMIRGPYGLKVGPHKVKKWDNPSEACVRCHVVEGDRWDTFYEIPPCGTVAETGVAEKDIFCVQCHMPAVDRPIVTGGIKRLARRHLWRGGHDPETVKNAIGGELTVDHSSPKNISMKFSLTNRGAAHYLPTGTPDRHLTVSLRALDQDGHLLEETRSKLIRTILWRPFIMDLWDTRLERWKPREFNLKTVRFAGTRRVNILEVIVKYHLLEESRRRKINYSNRTPISYEIYSEKIRIPSLED